jgi:hypothetical protein
MTTRTRPAPTPYAVQCKIGKHTACVNCAGPATIAYRLGIHTYVLCDNPECLADAQELAAQRMGRTA